MSFIQYLIIGIALSGPCSIVVGMVRGIICTARNISAKRTKFSIFCILAIAALLIALLIILGVWFAYGVAHTGKDTTTDLIVLASTVAPAYILTFIVWLLFRHLDREIRAQLTNV